MIGKRAFIIQIEKLLSELQKNRIELNKIRCLVNDALINYKCERCGKEYKRNDDIIHVFPNACRECNRILCDVSKSKYGMEKGDKNEM